MEFNNVICVIGDVMLDHYIYGACNRISPEAPVPIVEISRESFSLGGAGNVLKNIKSLGCKPALFSVIGEDKYAEIAFNELSNIDVSGINVIKDNSRCTTVKTRVIVSNHQLIRLDNELTHPVAPSFEQQLISRFNQTVNEFKIILISDYNKGLLTRDILAQLLSTCRNKGITTIVDPKGSDFSKYRGVNIVKPNKKEASLATGINITDDVTLTSACKKIKEITGCEYVIVTMSEDGIAIFSEEGLSIIPTKALAIVDVTGAGDTVLAALGVALLGGKTVLEACEFANHAAAIVINKLGSATVTIEEINANIKSYA